MNPLHALSIKTASAATRLAELKHRTSRAPADGRVASMAIRELESAVEELRVAIDHLHQMSDNLAASRRQAQVAEERYTELRDAMPVACVFTDEAGLVTEANAAAAEMFNISAQHLRGKALFLFVGDRDQFLKLLKESDPSGEPISVDFTVRPRDRKPRRVAVSVRHLPAHASRCWFFEEARSS